MTRRVSATEAKAHFSELVAQVAQGGERVVIEKHGKPVAALVSVESLDAEAELEKTEKKGDWVSNLAGLWGDVPNEVIDKLVADIYAERERDKGRPVDLEL